ncbi:MAG: hypothetical protein RR847_03550 [Bacilli bacterium]
MRRFEKILIFRFYRSNRFITINNNKFCFVFDFDKTLTSYDSVGTLEIYNQIFNEKDLKTRNKIIYFEKKILSFNVNDKLKIPFLNIIWRKKINLIYKHQKMFQKLDLSKIKLRSGVLELVSFCQNNNIPFVINSAGSKSIIYKIFRKNKLDTKNFKIYANEIVKNIPNDEIINTLTKKSNKDFNKFINEFDLIYLFGDMEEDLKTVNINKNIISYLLNDSKQSNFTKVVGKEYDFNFFLKEVIEIFNNK